MRVPAVLVALALLGGACGGGESEEDAVRETVSAFGEATAAKDYGRLCDDLFAPRLLEALDQIGLPCRVALEQSLGDVEDPRLVVGDIRVQEDTAEADVRSSAQGQAPSRDTLRLERTEEGWRISELGGGSATAPPPEPEPDHEHEEGEDHSDEVAPSDEDEPSEEPTP